jgi:hypothetical protein
MPKPSNGKLANNARDSKSSSDRWRRQPLTTHEGRRELSRRPFFWGIAPRVECL